MTIQEQVLTKVVIAPELTFGTAALANVATAKTIRRVTTSLITGKDIYQSNEARADQQVADLRHGTKRPGGSVDGELTNDTYDDLIEAVLRGAWTAGVTAAAADYTTVAGANTSGSAGKPGSTGTLAWTAGDPVAKGFRIGDVIGTTGAPSNGDDYNYRIISFGGTGNKTINVTPSPPTFAATALTGIKVIGKKVMTGVQKRSFTIEQLYSEVGLSELFTGMRAGGASFNIPPNGMATCSFNFMGQDGNILDSGTTPVSPYFTAATGQSNSGLMAGPSGSIRLAGAEQGVITALSLAIDLGLSADPVVGTNIVPDIFYGVTRVTGSVSFFLQDKSLMNVFVNEAEVDLTAVLNGNAAVSPNFLAFNMQRVKTTGVTKSISAQGGVVVTSPFSALLANAASGVDGATLSIQRSNT